MSFNKELDERTKQIVEHWKKNRKPEKKEILPTCKDCLFRDYGTDSHWVCKCSDYWFRVNEEHPICCQFMRKNK